MGGHGRSWEDAAAGGDRAKVEGAQAVLKRYWGGAQSGGAQAVLRQMLGRSSGGAHLSRFRQSEGRHPR